MGHYFTCKGKETFGSEVTLDTQCCDLKAVRGRHEWLILIGSYTRELAGRAVF